MESSQAAITKVFFRTYLLYLTQRLKIATVPWSVYSRSCSFTTIQIESAVPMRIYLQYAFAIVALTIYGGQV